MLTRSCWLSASCALRGADAGGLCRCYSLALTNSVHASWFSFRMLYRGYLLNRPRSFQRNRIASRSPTRSSPGRGPCAKGGRVCRLREYRLLSGATFTKRAQRRRGFRYAGRHSTKEPRPRQSARRRFKVSYSNGYGRSRRPIFRLPRRRRCPVSVTRVFPHDVEDRAGRGSQALQGRSCLDGTGPQTRPGACIFRCLNHNTASSISISDLLKAQLLVRNSPTCFAALQIYLGSAYVN